MVKLCILIGLGLLIGGVIIACATKNAGASRVNNVPARTPTRNVSSTPVLSATRPQPRTSTSRPSSTTALPPRRNARSNTVVASRSSITSCCGPRGVMPAQFPCCPFDKQRNIPGERQLIFWDNSENCYYCSRGHKFKSNGKLLFAN